MKKKKKPKGCSKATAWGWFSKYRRLLFADMNGMVKCVTCGKVEHFKEIHAGHFVASRNNTVLLMDELVFPQCSTCNKWLSGNRNKYFKFMLDQGYTAEELDEFDNLRFKTKKMTPQDWKEQSDKYRKLAKAEAGKRGIFI